MLNRREDMVAKAIVDDMLPESADAWDGDGDDKTYCICGGVSYGEMIACDEEGCDLEWVSFKLFLLQTDEAQ
jgi:inhibitor of growth protein 3